MDRIDADKVKAKIKIADQLFRLAYQIKKRQILLKHPELTDIEANHRAYRLIEKGCS